MKNSIFKGRKAGFTLAELLMVIAILVILIGLGVTGFLALRRNIQIAKYDDLAREIYVAVQNQLTRLEANGMDEQMLLDLKTGTPIIEEPQDYNTPKDADKPEWNVVKENYFHADQDKTKIMALLLPLGTVADDVRSNGYYVIEYNVLTKTVYGVFYSEKSFDYSSVSSATTTPKFRLSRETRKGPMVGYYGGSSVERDELKPCPTPELEIINNNELRLDIKNLNKAPEGVKILVTVSDGIVDKPVEVNATQIMDAVDINGKTVLLDGMNHGEHFHELFDTLTPGKDLTITVTYSKENCLSSSASVTANSLFATREPGEQPAQGGMSLENPGDTVTIAWARHLQNLESTVSGLNYEQENIKLARQTEHIQWKDTFQPFVSIQNESAEKKLKNYEGSNLEIRDLTGTNGLFSETGADVTLSGIRLVNPKIEAPAGTAQSVGALVGKADGSKIFSCGVYYNKINTANNTVDYEAYKSCGITNHAGTFTGGLIGTATKTQVAKAFAALPRIQANKGATLIGNATECTIESSYANCDNLPKENFAYFLNGSDNSIKHCYAVGNVANEKEDGTFADPDNTVTDSYYAVSHRKFAGRWEDNKDLAATEFRYMENGGWQEVRQEDLQKNPLGTGWSNGLIAPLTHPYREYLDGRKYPYPAIGDLDHYGSWPDSNGTVDLKITMQLPNDKKAGYAIFAGKVVVTTKDKDGNEITLFDSDEHKDEKTGAFDGVDTVKVAPGTKIKITIENAHGYEYTFTQIEEDSSRKTEVDYTVQKDTEVFVNFQKNTFKLKCEQSKKPGGAVVPGGYLAVLGDSRVVPSGSSDDKVETGTTITVQLSTPHGMKAGVVWYTCEGSDEVHMLVPNSDGNYVFSMPSANTTIHVTYTDQVAKFRVEYYVMDPEADPASSDSKYPKDPIITRNIEYAIGTVITPEVINTLAENSGRLLTIGETKVLYFEKAELYKHAGNALTKQTISYDTSKDAGDTQFTLKIMIARKTSKVTLVAGENIQKVSFKDIDGKEDPKTTSVTYYYGKKLTAVATVAPGQNFTTWEPDTGLFRASSSVENAIEVPYFDLTLTARAIAGYYQVTLNLLENEESWLAGSESRLADPIRITLESTKDESVTYEMEIPHPEAEDISYIAEATVKSIPDIGEGYKILVTYTNSGFSEYVKNPDGTDRIVKVRDRSVEEKVNFFTVTYFPDVEIYRGTVPRGGTYLLFHKLTVPGNVGHLRNDETNAKIFAGWYDAGVEAEGVQRKEFTVGQEYTVARRTDFFVNWKESLRVIYNANDGVEADDPDQTFAATGELPTDSRNYQNDETVKVKAGSLTRKGYTFLGWSTVQNAAKPEYLSDQIFTIGESDVILYAVWQQEEYTLTFLNPDGTEMRTEEGKHYGDRVPAPVCAAGPKGEAFLGWATDPGGDVAYPKGTKIPVTGNQTFYPRFDAKTVEVTYHYGNNNTVAQMSFVGEGIPFYLNCDAAGDVTAWRTVDSKDFYLCEEGTARSLETASFTGNIDLYAVYGKVYNFNRQEWYETLYDAVNAGKTQADDTLIVYRDTTETKRIRFTENLYVLANGNRKVKWENYSYDDGDGAVFVGCMYVKNCNVSFGRSNISTLSMNGSSLIFDANHLSRVIALDSGAEFNMHRGITLTNGALKGIEGSSYSGTDVPKQYCGGGLYAGVDSRFNMYGGTISYCTAFRGGGVYLYGNKGSQNQGAKMYMGAMEHPTAYSATAIHYVKDGKYYKNVDRSRVTLENYKSYFVATGDPEICYNVSTNNKTDFSSGDGGGGLLMLDLPDGFLELYKGSIHNNETSANGGGIVTDGGGKDGSGKDLGNTAQLRIYEVDISHNSAAGCGGGIFQWQGVVYIYNSTIRQNNAGKHGGGIYLHHYANYNKENPEKNVIENSDVDFYFGDIADNRAGDEGGGVFVEGDLKMWIRNGNLCRNKAGGAGGGIQAGGGANDGGANGAGGWKSAQIYFSGGAIYDNKGNAENNNDIYLRFGTVVTVMDGGLHLSMNNPGQTNTRIHVDGWPGQAFQRGNPIVEYRNAEDFKEEDADLFCFLPLDWYWNGFDHLKPYRFQILPTEQDGQLIPPLILWDYGDLDTRTLEFYKNDGTLNDAGNPVKVDKTAKVGDVVTDFPSATSDTPFTREGYYIGGWARDPDAYEEDYVAYYNSTDGTWYMEYGKDGVAQWTNPADVPTITVDQRYDQRFYAMWKPYVVRYNLNNADPSIESLADGIGPKVQILGPAKDSFVRDGVTYSFRGWSTTENANKPDPNYAVGEEIQLTNQDVTLYAVWRPSVVKFTFDFNGGSDNASKTQDVVTVTRGEPLTIPLYSITRTNKGFGGWSKVKDGAEDYQTSDLINTADETEDMTLYAVWKDIYNVTFHLTGGQVEGDPANRVKPVIQGEPVSLNEKPKQVGWRFKGWAEEENGTVIYDREQTSMIPSGNLDLYAVWEEQWWTVFFNLQEGQGPIEPKQVRDGQSLTIPAEEPTWTDGTCKFRGWSLSEDGTGERYNAGGTISAITSNTTLYAVWKQSAAINFYLDDPTPEAGAWKTMDAAMEDQITVESPVREGFQFVGWKDHATGTVYPSGTPIEVKEAVCNLYAVWEAFADTEWQLIFQLNGPNAVWTEPLQIVANITDSITIPTVQPRRDGYVFEGWENPDEVNRLYQPGNLVTKPDTNFVKLCAKWASAVTITYDLQGGTGNFNSVIKEAGLEHTLPTEQPEKEGFAFKGWKDHSNKQWNPGDKMTITEDTTLYAIWQQKTCTVTFHLEGGSVNGSTTVPTQTTNQGEKLVADFVPTRDGYRLVGWAETPGGTTITEIVPKQDTMALYAVWEAVTAQSTEELTKTDLPSTNEASANTQEIEAATQTTAQAASTPSEEEPKETTKPVTEEKPTEAAKPAAEGKSTEETKPAVDTKPTEAAQPVTKSESTEATQPETDGKTTENPTETETAPSEEEAVYKVTFYLDGGELKKHAKLSDKELEDYEWDKKEKKFVYTVPAGKDRKILPPEVVREGYFCDGWLWKDGDEEKKYPADKKIPVTDGMELRPIWKKVELPPPPAETTAQPNPTPTEATAPVTETKPTEPVPPVTEAKPTEPEPTAAPAKSKEPAPTETEAAQPASEGEQNPAP